MSAILTELLATRYANQEKPPWIDPFLAAARRMYVLETRNKDGTHVTAETKAERAAATAAIEQSLIEEKGTKKGKAKAKGKAKKVVVEPEVEDGLGEVVEDDVMAAAAEDLLKTASTRNLLSNTPINFLIPSSLFQAIELGEHKEVFPYTWITILRMQRGDWTPARETALRAAELQPYDATILFRLSACYGQERDFVNAHRYYELGLALLSVPERISYIAKLELLRQQSDDVKNNVYKEDPLEILPLEVVINIFRFGLDEDPLLALKGSWVNQRWRNTINHNCPEMWRTWTVNDGELRSQQWDERRKTWLFRAGGVFDTISLNSLDNSAIYRLPSDLQQYAPNVKRLEVEAQNMDILDTFAAWNKEEMNVESLRLAIESPKDPWGGSKYRFRAYPSEVINCNVHVNADNLRSLQLLNIGFASQRIGWDDINEIPEPFIVSYPALKHLSVENCLFSHRFAETTVNDPREEGEMYLADVLHNTLRGAPVLEHLEVTVSWYNRRSEAFSFGRPISMDKLKVAILPPVSVHPIDILAPNLKSIAFKLLKMNDSYTSGAPTANRRALIPPLAYTPVTVDSIVALETVEFVTSAADGISRLEAWISRLPNVTKLVIRDIERCPYPPPYRKSFNVADRTSNRALQLLNDNPDWCPALTTLHFESCFAPGRELLRFVKKRSQSSTTASINKLTLEGCTKLSKKAKTALTREVTQFEIQAEYDTSSKSGVAMMKKYMGNRF